MPIGKSHEHVYELKVIDVVADNPKYDSEKYGYKALLVEDCACGHRIAHKYGERKAIHQLYDEMLPKRLSEG
jgi:hypothetical protein